MGQYSRFGNILFLTLAFLLVFPVLAHATTIYVRTDGLDTNDGLSWGTAKKTIQAGINASVATDEVWVAGGKYTESVALKSGVKLLGGCSGVGTTRDIAAYVTTISSSGGSTVTSPTGTTADTVIEGFTIRDGGSLYGGGMNIKGSPTISRNIITQNQTWSSTDSAGNPIGAEGAGIRCESGSPVIMNNTISGNIFGSGSYPIAPAGIYCKSSASATIVGNAVLGNHYYGVYCDGPLTLVGNTIVGNSSNGLMYLVSAAVVVNNIVAFNGAGVSKSSGATPTYRNNCVYGNTSYNYSGWSPNPTGTNGNISVDPKLAGVEYGGVHLQLDSPCIGGGDNTYVQAGWKDIDGQDRIQPVGGTVDIGADESDGTAPTVVVRVFRVTPTGDDANDGSAWDDGHAKRTVHAAIDAASLTGGEVWVKAGVYVSQDLSNPDVSRPVKTRAFTYLYGGFSGDEIARDDRDWASNRSILEGKNGTVIQMLGGHVYCAIDGFTIRRGDSATVCGIACQYTSGTISHCRIIGNGSFTAAQAGGIWCDGGWPTIANNVISGNSGDAGSAIYLISSSPKIVNNTICDNNGANGAISYGSYCSPTIANNIIAFNTSGIRRYSSSSSSPVLRSNCVYGNTLGNYLNGVTPGTGDTQVDPKFGDTYTKLHLRTDSPCIGTGNNTYAQSSWKDIDGQDRIQPGGGTVDRGADESDGSAPPPSGAIIRVTPSGNDANDGSAWDDAHAKLTIQAGIDAASTDGGEVWVKAGAYGSDLHLLPYAGVYGGFAGTETARSQRNYRANPAVMNAGAVDGRHAGYLVSTLDGFRMQNGCYVSCGFGAPIIANNVITGTSMTMAGAIYCLGGGTVVGNVVIGNKSTGIYGSGLTTTITNNTIAYNDGGGIYITGAGVTIVNNIVALNTGVGIRCDSAYTRVLRNNCVYGNSTNYQNCTAGTGDIQVDPKLADINYGNAHLRTDSPCIGVGDNTVVTVGQTDMDAQSRILPAGGTVDMGADESDGTSWPLGPYAFVRVTPTGNDANDGSSWDDGHAKRTVQAGVDAAAIAGGEAWVKAGTYYEHVALRQFAYAYGGFSGSESSKSARNYKLNASTIDGQATNCVVSAIGGYKYAALDGFALRNGIGYFRSLRRGGGIYVYNTMVTLANNTITGCTASLGGGVYVESSTATLTGNSICGNNTTHQAGGGAVHILSAGAGTVVDNNVIANNAAATSSAAGVSSDNANVSITNNTVVGNRTGISGSFSKARNNIVAFNKYGISASSLYTSSLFANDVYGNTSANYYNGITQGSTDIVADPLLADKDNGDYHLQTGSPCIDAGSSTSAPATDIEGCIRPQDGDGNGTALYDIGAYEYPMSLAKAKKDFTDGSAVAFGGTPVTAIFTSPARIYVERSDRSQGIRVDTDKTFSEGELVNVSGTIQTDPATDERYVLPSSSYPASMSMTSVLRPCAMANRFVGGADSGLQKGVLGGVDLNNIGLLVTILGSVVQFDAPENPSIWFKITDGSPASVKVQVPSGVTINKNWQYVIVTGVVSCEKSGSDLVPVLKVRKQADIVPVITGS